MPPTVEARAYRVVADVFGISIEDVTPETSHQNVEAWDSVNMITLMAALEAEFDVSIDVEEAAELVSVQRVIETLRSKGVTGASPEARDAGTSPP